MSRRTWMTKAHVRPAHLVIAAALAALSLWARAQVPEFVIADAVYDDALAARLTGNLLAGDWLGEFTQFTLAKGPGYSLASAAAWHAHLPLKVAEQALLIAAAGVTSWAVVRAVGRPALGVTLFGLLVLDPAFLGPAAARMYRDGFYSTAGLLMFGLTLLSVTLLPPQGAWRWRALIPVMLSGACLGVVTAAYWLTREERIWLVPSLAVLVTSGVLLRLQRWPTRLVASMLLVVSAGVPFLTAVGVVRGANSAAYGVSLTTDFAEGAFPRAMAAWQSVQIGPTRQGVPITRDQRLAVYAISPAASRLKPHLEGSAGQNWIAISCYQAQVCDDLAGGWSSWAFRDAADATGGFASAADAQRLFGSIAKDIEEACVQGALACKRQLPAFFPPLDQISLRRLADAMQRSAVFLARYDIAGPNRPSSQGGPEGWALFSGANRSLPSTLQAHLPRELQWQRSNQWATALRWLYAGSVIAAILPAIVGTAIGLLRGRGPMRLGAWVAAAALLAVATRLGLVALIDATSYPAATVAGGIYLLAATPFLLVGLVLGTWLLVEVSRPWLRERSRLPTQDGAASPTRGAPG